VASIFASIVNVDNRQVDVIYRLFGKKNTTWCDEAELKRLKKENQTVESLKALCKKNNRP
jgi:hypothetical protein